MDDRGLSVDSSDDGTFVPFTDILFNALLGLAVMVFMAFALINPEAKTGIVDLKAEFIITVQWPDGHADDVDTYVEDPAGGHRLVPFARGGFHGPRSRRSRQLSRHADRKRPEFRTR